MVGNNLRQEIPAKIYFRRISWLVACLLLLMGCSRDQSNPNDFLNEKLVCPPPAVAEYEAWGESGTQQVCKIKHGPFFAWESGYIHVRGQYEMGKKTGIWYWYDKNGKVVKEIDYSLSSNGDNK